MSTLDTLLQISSAVIHTLKPKKAKQHHKRYKKMRGHMPEDVIQQILMSLPVKSLLRFMSVCRSWESLIKSPSFVSSHLSGTNSTDKDCEQQQLLLVGCWVNHKAFIEWQYSLHVDGNEYKTYRKLPNFSWETLRLNYDVVGCCNGLLCLRKWNVADSYYLWNPTIQKSFTVSESNLDDRIDAIIDGIKDGGAGAYRGRAVSLDGFGFDSTTNDYKLLRIVHVLVYEGCNHDGILWDGWIDIYSYNAGSWKDITPADELHFRMILDEFSRPRLPFVKGFLYCLGRHHTRSALIVWGFDVAREVFREIILPEEIGQGTFSKSITAYGDSSIALFECSVSGFNLWLMQESSGSELWSWTKMFVIVKDEANFVKEIPLLVGKNGELLMQKSRRGIVSYNPGRKQCHFLCKEGYNSFVNYYVESLALLDI